jgi:hypothetical protein
MSETQNIMTQSPDDKNKQHEKNGLKLAGYVIPWWVLAVVVLVLLYLAYDNHMFDFVCNPNKQIAFVPNIRQGVQLPSILPPSQMNQAVQIPQNLKNLFSL